LSHGKYAFHFPSKVIYNWITIICSLLHGLSIQLTTLAESNSTLIMSFPNILKKIIQVLSQWQSIRLLLESLTPTRIENKPSTFPLWSLRTPPFPLWSYTFLYIKFTWYKDELLSRINILSLTSINCSS